MKIRYMGPVLLAAALAGCSQAEKIDDTAQGDSGGPDTLAEQPGEPKPTAQPVRIGEGGGRFDACQATGQVRGLGRRPSLDVLNAPFDDASVKRTLPEGQKVFICTRSIDQQWLGVVIPGAAPAPVPSAPASSAAASPDSDSADTGSAPEPPPATDCGVSSPVRSKRNYDGPCDSGWVEATYIKLIAG